MIISGWELGNWSVLENLRGAKNVGERRNEQWTVSYVTNICRSLNSDVGHRRAWVSAMLAAVEMLMLICSLVRGWSFEALEFLVQFNGKDNFMSFVIISSVPQSIG